MPSLLEKTENQGPRGEVWQVKWMWLPFFLAQDPELIRSVDKRLTQLFQGGPPPKEKVLESALIQAICQKYPMKGLREALEVTFEAIRDIELAPEEVSSR